MAPGRRLTLYVSPRLSAILAQGDSFVDLDHMDVRFGLGLMYSHMNTIRPAWDEVLNVGTRYVARFEASRVVGTRTASELELALQLKHVGIYGRVGYQTDPVEGATYSVGVELGSGAAKLAVVTSLAVALLVYAVANLDWEYTGPP